MKYALLMYAIPRSEQAEPGHDPDSEKRWAEYIRDINDAGVLVAVERLHGTDTATSVRVREGERLLTDGPFMETKEHLLGFFLIDVPDLDTALDWVGKMPFALRGTVEVRAVMTGEPWRELLG